MRHSRGMGCIAKNKLPDAKGRTIVRKDKPQFVKEYVKGGHIKQLAEGGESKVNEAGNYTKPSKRKALFVAQPDKIKSKVKPYRKIK